MSRGTADAFKTKEQIWTQDEDKLLLLEGWARDGMSYKEIALCIDISQTTLLKWREKHEQFRKALETNMDLINYKVENGLLKSALGYRAKDSKVLLTMDAAGAVISRQTETIERDVAPNANAALRWLYNRKSGTWRHDTNTLVDITNKDDEMHIIVTRADDSTAEMDLTGGGQQEVDQEWLSDVNKSANITINRKQKQAEQKPAAEAVVVEDNSEWEGVI